MLDGSDECTEGRDGIVEQETEERERLLDLELIT